MLTKEQVADARTRTQRILAAAGIALTQEEQAGIEVADFGLGQLEQIGLEIVTYVNNDRYCAKELVLFAGQICPEHRHPSVSGRPGKQETFRCRTGTVHLYVPGPRSAECRAVLPAGSEKHFTVFHCVTLEPGRQYTLTPDTLHWFQAGPAGAIVSEFSSTSADDADIFTDPRIQRATKIA